MHSPERDRNAERARRQAAELMESPTRRRTPHQQEPRDLTLQPRRRDAQPRCDPSPDMV